MTAAADDNAPFGGQPPRPLARLGFGVAAKAGPARAAALAVSVGWLPLPLLLAAQGTMLPGAELGSFVRDVGVHARSLVAVPLLILADAVCAPRLSAIANHFLDAGLIHDHQRSRFDAALASTRRLDRSPLANAVLFAVAFILTLVLLWSVPSAAYPTWHTGGLEPAGIASLLPRRSLAGWWHALVSLPLLFLLTLGWLWRLGLWGRLLWLVSRLELRLVPSHPDRCAGLRFVGYSLRAFGIVALALGCVGAGRMANNIVHRGMSPFAHRYAVLVGTILIVALFLAPLLAFTPRLLREWRRGIFQYGSLADRLGRAFERRWFGERRAVAEADLEVQDFSAVTDAYSIVANAQAMRLVPVDWKSIALLAGAVLLPFVPLAFLALPLDTIFRALARLFV